MEPHFQPWSRSPSVPAMVGSETDIISAQVVLPPSFFCVAASDGRHFSCRLDSNGWGWLVTGRKLYVWRHTPEIGKKSPISCRELVLPPSELVHHANLVAVLPSCSTTAPAVLALSPEGHITYWPNISNESNTVTVNADIPGQECDSLTSIWPVGAIVTTTTSTVLLIKTSSGRGNKPGLSCVPLVAQKSWLGGWSKKMSTMLFTAVPSAPSGLDSVSLLKKGLSIKQDKLIRSLILEKSSGGGSNVKG